MFRRSAKVISIILTVVFVFNVFVYPAQTALAVDKTADNQIVITYEDGSTDVIPSEPTEQPEPTESPEPSDKPEETLEPTPTIVPEPSTEPSQSPSESPEISDTQSEDTVILPEHLALESLLDADGFLSDEGLLSLQLIPYEEEKYIDVSDNKDGTKSLKQYFTPIKYKNDKGEYELIDNSVVKNENKDNEHEYKNKASDIDVLLSEDIDQDNAIEVNYEEYSVGFKPIKNDPVKNEIESDINFIEMPETLSEAKDNVLEETKIDKKNTGESKNIKDIQANDVDSSQDKDDDWDSTKDYDSVEYTNVFDESTDIQIIPVSTGIKEDIILNELPEETEFSYELTVQNLTPLLRRDGNIYFVDLDKSMIIYAIASPSMYDSSEESRDSNSIEVKLEKIDDDTYKYTLIPDREFLESAVYPIVLDPTISTKSAGTMADSYITSRYPNNNYWNDQNIKVGNSQDLGLSRGLARMTFPSYLDGYTITSACYYALQNYVGDSRPTIYITNVTNDWCHATVTWANQPGMGGVYAALPVQAIGWCVWDITSLVTGWRNGTIPNYGIYIRNENEGLNMYKRFYSCDSGNYDTMSFLDYTYEDPKPSTPNISINNSNWVRSTTINWNVPNPGYGASLTGIYYSLDGGDWVFLWQNASTGSFSNESLPDGIHNIRVAAKNSLGLWSPASSSVTYKKDTTAPTPTNLTCTPQWNEQAKKYTLVYNWSAVTDTGIGLDKYEIKVWPDGATGWTSEYVTSGTTYTWNNCSDNASHTFVVKAIDKLGNSSDWAWNTTMTQDKTGPFAPTSFKIDVDNPVNVNNVMWTNDTSPTISWSGITDPGYYNHLVKVQYSLDGGDWTDIGTNYGVASGSYPFNAASWSDGQHSIRIRGMDSSNNPGTPSEYVYYNKDTTGPNASLVLGAGNLNGIESVAASITDGSGSGVANWVLDYGEGNPAVIYDPLNELKSSNVAVNGKIFEWDTSKLEDNNNYTLRLRAYDKVGNSLNPNTSAPTQIRFKATGSEYVSPQLQIDEPIVMDSDEYQDINDVDMSLIRLPQINVLYQKLNNGGTEGLTPGKLYVNNELRATETAAGAGMAFNAAAYEDGKWVYPEGSIAFLYTQARDSENGELYSTGTQQALQIADKFTDTNQIEGLDHVELINSDSIELTKVGGIYDNEGHFESKTKPFAGDISYIDLTVDQTVPTGSTVKYEVLVNGEWQEIEPVSADGGITVDPAKREYFIDKPIGDSVKMRATLTKSPTNQSPTISSWSMDVRYTTYANALLIDNDFPENARGMTGLVNTYHFYNEETGAGYIELVGDAPEGTTGWVYSTVRVTSNDVTKVCLKVEETPGGAGIIYYVSTQGGAVDTWQEIAPSEQSSEQWIDVASPGKEIVLRARLTGSGLNSPHLLSWKLGVQEKLAGSPFIVKLVDEPWNLSALTDVTHRTLLRWEASSTEGVTYNVYRSTTPYFVPCDELKVAEGITETSWYDPYVDFDDAFGKTFYYKVTALKVLPESGTDVPRESLPSNEERADVPDKDEIEKYLGLQNYWSYTGFSTGSGTGYVNVANGNMSYITTDIVVSDPFFATVMRRTFNSMATTKTPMGKGWDFSFNTCLLRENNSDGSMKAMILKDGDGTFHYFAYENGSFKSAKGTFMELLTPDDLQQMGIDADEYQIRRKDNIIYHFDAVSLKLTSFSDSNGNELKFTYDVRGNLKTVENTVGEKVELEYKVVVPGDSDYSLDHEDYVYVNEHPDMLDTVKWTAGAPDNPVSITYQYDYNDDNNKLERAYTTVEHNMTYEEVFSYNAAGQLITISDPEDKETSISYGAGDRIASITDASGESYSYTYELNVAEKPVSTTVTNPMDIAISYDYDEDGLVTTKTDALGHSINYTYGHTADDEFLVTGMNYLNSVNGGDPQTISYSYSYINGNLDIITAPDGTITDYGTYNSFNKPASVTVSKGSDSATTNYSYDPSTGNLQTTTDPEGKDTTNTYSTLADPVNGHAGYLTQVQGDYGNQTRYSYDTKGRVTQVTEYDNGTLERTASTYSYSYDPAYNTDGHYFMNVTATDAMGNSVTSYYDMLGRTVKKVYPDNPDNTVDPDVYECWLYDLVGNVKWMRDRSGSETSYLYDNLYRMYQADYADGSHSYVDYTGKWDSDNNDLTGDTSNGNDADFIKKTDGTGIESFEYYDMAGRLVKTSTSDGTNELVTAQYAYDNIGNCTQVTDNADRVSQAQYNVVGQKTKTIVDPITPTNLTGENIETTYLYDFLGNQASMTDGESNTTSYDYDNDSRLKSVTQTLAGNALTTSYLYDTREDGFIKNRVTNANGQVSETWFDNMGRKVKDYNIGNTGDSTVMQTSYTYNANNQPDIVTRNDSTKEKYTYTASGAVKRVDYYEAAESTTGNSDDYIEYEYSNSGKVTKESVIRAGVTNETVYVYNSMGRLRQMQQGTGTGTLTINYLYDNAGRVRYISYAKDNVNRILDYEYDNFGRLKYIKLAMEELPASADIPLTTAKIVREYVYKANGDLDHTKDFRNFDGATGAGDITAYIKTAYTINNAGLATGITYTDYASDSASTGTVKEQYTMGYDKRGYITSETAVTNYSTSQNVNKSYQYDAIGRLTQATIGNKTNTYTYDNIGNRLSMNDGTDTLNYTYDTTGFNRLMTITKGQDEYITYEYDGRGNQTSETQKYLDVTINGTTTSYNKTTKYNYDLSNQLASLTVSTPEANQYTGDVTYKKDATTNEYNAGGQRIVRTLGDWVDSNNNNVFDAGELQNGIASKYYYTGSKILYTTNADNWLMTENILDLAGSIIASKRFDDQNTDTQGQFANQYFFYHYDNRGSTTAIIKPDGTPVEEYTYDAFGNLNAKGTSGFKNEVTFTGSVTDKSSGLQYMNARFYNPSTGRFLSQDTYSGNPYEPWTQHLYSYCGNNPVNMVDPTGHVVEWVATMWGIAIAEPTPFGEIIAGLVTIGVAIFCGEQMAEIGENIFSNPSTSTSVTITAGTLTTGITVGITGSIAEERKIYPPAKRKTYSGRKEAYEAAKKAGRGKEPKHDPNGHPEKGDPRPHYQPDVKDFKNTPKAPSPHDHHYYPRGR